MNKTITNDILKAVWQAIEDKFGADTVILDISGISPMADYFIITTGGNPNQIKAISDAAEEALYKKGLKIRHSEGTESLKWLLMDFGDIIVHVFDKESREFYDLERVWADAAKVDTTAFLPAP